MSANYIGINGFYRNAEVFMSISPSLVSPNSPLSPSSCLDALMPILPLVSTLRISIGISHNRPIVISFEEQKCLLSHCTQKLKSLTRTSGASYLSERTGHSRTKRVSNVLQSNHLVKF